MENKNIEEKVNYCLNCKTRPCEERGCPLKNDIPKIISLVKENKILEAYKVLSKTTVLPGVCGRICPHMKQCEGSCIRAIRGEAVEIGNIEAYVYDKSMNSGYSLAKIYKEQIGIKSKENKNKKVAIIGGGPAGLTCAAFLAMEGISVKIFEKYEYLGGILIHGIPEFRLSKNIVNTTIKNILDLGIEVEYKTELGKNINLDKLEKEYDAIFISSGANKSLKLGIKGEMLNGVFGGNELLEYKNHPDYTRKIASIIGGGNVAIDCARTIKKLGAKKVQVIYRREKDQMPAEAKEIDEAIEEGIEFLFKNNIVEIKGDDKVQKIELIKTKLVKKEGDSRLSPVNIEGSNYEVETDYIVTALGAEADLFVEELELELNRWGRININELYETSKTKIYAGGDLAGIKATVAWASYSGREAAKEMIKKLI